MTLLLCALFAAPAPDPRAGELLQAFLGAVDRAQSLTFTMRKTERLRDGEIVRGVDAVKFKKPGWVFMRQLEPHRAQEVLYRKPLDPGRLIAHPGRFPFLTLTLDIHGSLALRGHHPVSHMGFEYLAASLRKNLEREQREPSGGRLEYKGREEIEGRPVEVVILHCGQRPPRQVRGKKGESLFDFAARVESDGYVVFQANPSIGSVTSDLAARDYTVPACYASRTELAIDPRTGMVWRHRVTDETGALYELYEYSELVVDPPLPDAEFDPDNPAYDF